mgnify:CR=1 FL=1
MTTPDHLSESAAADAMKTLRMRAEEVALRKEVLRPESPWEPSSGTLLQKQHELQVHQIELEMQNTELRRTQEELAAARARYFELYDLAPVGYCTVSQKGVILEANLTASVMLGMTRGALVGQPIFQFIAREDQDTYFLHRKHLFDHETLRACELRMVKVDGSLVWVSLQSAVAQEDTGTPVQFLVLTNITERRQAEQALLESEQHYRTLANAGSALIWTAGLDGMCNYFNDIWLRFTGRTLAQEIGTGWAEGVHPQDRQGCLETYNEAFKRQAAFSLEYRLRRADGAWRWIRDDGTPRLDSHGQFIGYIGHCVDITAQKEATAELERHRHHLEALVKERTEELEQARKAAEAANLAKSAFLANMSHEIRTPLNAITGLAMLMRHAGTTPQQTDRLDKIEKAGQHLLEIINAILDLSKIDAGKFTLEETMVDPRKVVNNVAALLMELARAKNLRLIVDIQQMPDHLLGDPTRLQQALLNYTSNAIKFTPAGTITLRAQTVETADDAVTVRFEVQDTGIGIAPEVLPRLFSSFEQGEVTTTRIFGGTGLGLAITKRLARLMGGDVGVSSQPGAGSTFWFTARLKNGQAIHVTEDVATHFSAEAMLIQHHQGRRVLLVEDEPVNQEVMREVLGDVGFAIESAMDGEQAVALASQHRYDLILMDVQLPKMDGLEATRRIRLLPGGAQTPIIALTANAFAEDRKRCMEAGMDDFVAKPFEPEPLFGVLLKWLDRGRG